MGFYNFLQNYLIILSYVLLYFSNHGVSVTCNHKSNFFTGPTDTTVREGENATFTCAVANVNETDRIIWHVNPSQYQSVIQNSFNKSSGHMVSRLTVYNVGRKSQSNWCELYILNPDFSVSSCLSNIATLASQYFPTPDEISCGSNAANPLQEGDQIKAWCEVVMGNPLVDLEWFTGDLNPLNHSYHLEDGRLSLSQEIKVTKVFQKRPITCIATSLDVFPHQQLSCNVGPFVVYYKPTVSVTPTEGTLNVSQNNSIELTCSVQGYPPVKDLSWACVPSHIIEGCQSSNRSITITIKSSAVSYEYNDTFVLVTCTAGNMIGTDSSSANITIEKTQLKNLDKQEYDKQAHWDESNTKEISTILQTERLVTYESSSNVTKADEGSFILMAFSGTSTKGSTNELSSEDMNMVNRNIEEEVAAGASQPTPKTPQNIYLITTASVAAGILLSAGLFTVISIAVFRHFQVVTTQIASNIQHQHDTNNDPSEHPEMLSTSRDRFTESIHIYEGTGFLGRSFGQYAMTQTLYRPSSSTSEESSENSDGLSTSNSYKSSHSLDSSQEEDSYSTPSIYSRHDGNELEDVYGNQVVLKVKARDPNEIHFQTHIVNMEDHAFPEPPSFPINK